MSVDTETNSAVPDTLTRRKVCPFCGEITVTEGPCPRCSVEATEAVVAATRQRIGPWYVLQKRNPSAPGMRYATLLALIERGQVQALSIVRGPTTHQLWKFAAQVRGVSRLFGVCHQCGQPIQKDTHECPACQALQTPPDDPDQLLESAPKESRMAPADLVLAERATAPANVKLPEAGDNAEAAHTANTPRETNGKRPHHPAAPARQHIRSTDPPPTRRPAVPAPAVTEDLPANSNGDNGATGDNGAPDTALAASTTNSVDSNAKDDRPNDGILSARELAAAFQLEFADGDHADDHAKRNARKGPSILLPLILFILLAIAGAAAYVFVNPETRTQVQRWFNALTSSPEKQDDGPEIDPIKIDPNKGGEVPIDDGGNGQTNVNHTPGDVFNKTHRGTNGQNNNGQTNGNAEGSDSTTKASVQKEPGKVVNTEPIDYHSLSKPQQQKLHAKAVQLHRAAIDLNGQRRYREALIKLRQLKAMPKEVIPGGADFLLKRVEDALRSE